MATLHVGWHGQCHRFGAMSPLASGLGWHCSLGVSPSTPVTIYIVSILTLRSTRMYLSRKSLFHIMIYVIVSILTLRSARMSLFQIMIYVLVSILTLRSARKSHFHVMINVIKFIYFCIHVILQPAESFKSVIIKWLAPSLVEASLFTCTDKTATKIYCIKCVIVEHFPKCKVMAPHLLSIITFCCKGK